MSVAQIDVDALQADALHTTKPEHILMTYWNRLRRHRLATASLVLLMTTILIVIVGPIILEQQTYYNVSKDEYVPYARDTQDLAARNAAPTADHWLGTDELGRDVLYRLLVAGRLSLFIAFTVTLVSETFGMFVGSLSGYYGKWIDSMIQRIVEFIIILPALPLLLVLSSILRDLRIPFLPVEWSQAVVIIFILSILGWTGACRQARGMVLSLR
ncbi:MAG: ABC transporter permease, partial [Chloroflexi bacterium]|nr:ABC transporter permease [Chloroflexota bacterium]